MKTKGITTGTYTEKKVKRSSDLPMCPTCKKCKDRSICKNRKLLKNCSVCKSCTDKDNCDKFYHYTKGRATLTIGKNIETKEPIRKSFTADTIDEALDKLYKYKIEMQENGKDLEAELKKTTKSIAEIGQEIEDSKFRKGKTKGNAYRTNMATLNRIKENKFANIPIDKVKKTQVEKFLEERSNTNENKLFPIVEVADISKQKDFDEYGCITYTERARTEIKIQDGCNNFCSYCLIPYARGRIRSRKKENILREVEIIANNGIKEIVLTGIHIASYGKDFENGYKLIDLLEDLNNVEGIERIRLGSLEPTIITEEFVQRLSKLKKICNHFHLSLQSGCNETLKRMNRKYTIEGFKNATERLRKFFKDVNLTTDVIVGFPGENDEEFDTTYNFLKEIAFYKMHIFKYSKRDGTVAAKMPNQIDGNTAEERSRKLIELSENNMKLYNEKYLGKEVEVLFEEKQDDYWIGHTRNYMVVKIKDENDLQNEIKKIKIKESCNEEMLGILQK